ncbi:Conserved_hypothetical protein [Hexamita inflata]|uniref:Uncharacterized protein n=1 Tax=Hexamita inflata TaxID=28002 RepID=A0AA86UA34_9EUKA|nr:Conserved hypothetical protein [Hexamita inflata]
MAFAEQFFSLPEVQRYVANIQGFSTPLEHVDAIVQRELQYKLSQTSTYQNSSEIDRLLSSYRQLRDTNLDIQEIQDQTAVLESTQKENLELLEQEVTHANSPIKLRTSKRKISQTSQIQLKLEQLQDFARSGINTKYFAELGCCQIFQPSFQQLKQNYQLFAIFQSAQYQLSRSVRVQSANGFIAFENMQIFAPDVLGVGAVEYLSQLLKIQNKLQQTILVCTNIDSQLSRHTKSEVLQLESLGKMTKIIIGRHNLTSYQNIVKFLPIVYKGNMRNNATIDVCCVLTSFVPPKYVDLIRSQVSQSPEEIQEENDLSIRIRDFEQAVLEKENQYIIDQQKYIQDLQIDLTLTDTMRLLQLEKHHMEQEVFYQSQRESVYNLKHPAYPALKSLAQNQYIDIREQALQMVLEADPQSSLRLENVFLQCLSQQLPVSYKKESQFKNWLTIEDRITPPQIQTFQFQCSVSQFSDVEEYKLLEKMAEEKISSHSQPLFQIQNFKNIEFDNAVLKKFDIQSDIVSLKNYVDPVQIHIEEMNGISKEQKYHERVILNRFTNVYVNKINTKESSQYLINQLQTRLLLKLNKPLVLLLSSKVLLYQSVLFTPTDSFRIPESEFAADYFKINAVTNLSCQSQFPQLFSKDAELVTFKLKLNVLKTHLYGFYQDYICCKSFAVCEVPFKPYMQRFGLVSDKLFAQNEYQKKVANRLKQMPYFERLEYLKNTFDLEKLALQCVVDENAEIEVCCDKYLLESTFGQMLRRNGSFVVQQVGIRIGEVLDTKYDEKNEPEECIYAQWIGE